MLATTQDANTMAVKISMVQAAPEQLHPIKARSATVTGAMATAATPARCRRVTLHSPQNQIARVSP